MKNLINIIIFIMALLPSIAWAQEEEDLPQTPDPKVKEKIQAARVAYLTDQLGLTPEEAEKFWPVYREFSERRQELKKQYREAKKNPDPKKSVDENERNLVDLQLKLKQQEVDLERDYSGRLLKVISAQKLRELPEAEHRFRQMILKQIQRRQMQQERRENIRDRSQERLRQRNN
jgi:hypothetical protein